MQALEHSRSQHDLLPWYRIKSAFKQLVADKAMRTRERLNSMRVEAERFVTVSGIVLEVKPDEPEVPLERYVSRCAKPLHGSTLGGFCRQGNLQLYSTACLTARQLLRTHPVLSDSIRRLWRLISVHDDKRGLIL